VTEMNVTITVFDQLHPEKGTEKRHRKICTTIFNMRRSKIMLTYKGLIAHIEFDE